MQSSSATAGSPDLSKPYKNATDSRQASGLHIECADSQLHLGKVDWKIKWHIINGFKAWSTLRKDGIGQYPHSDGLSDERQQNVSADIHCSHSPAVDHQAAKCPFAAQHIAKVAARDISPSPSGKSGLKLQDNVRLGEDTEDPIAAEARPAEVRSRASLSHVPSQAASASKCPIRFLDQHSPEEIAEYFQNHRHEIPRSHELCVKRYQRSEDQIRQLDHKYGSLVNMIQGLGEKHQPMLHTRTDGDNVSQGRTSQGKVEAWAHEVDDSHKNNGDSVDGVDGAAGDGMGTQRDGRFDRPLKEIRVGESPSRPWGISVPQAAPIPPSAVVAQEKPEPDAFHQPELPTPLTVPFEQRRTKSPVEMAGRTERQPRMIFTGPVFMGYSPQEITDILQRTGLGKSNSHR